MKRLLISIFLLGAIATANGQNMIDALRYSQTIYGGTARAVAMGGAFSALGGDISSLSYNPGGIGVYRSNELTITPTLMFNETKSDYFNGGKMTDNAYNFNFNNIGIVASYSSKSDMGWANINFAVGYNKLNNFNRNINYGGINPKSSITDLWADQAYNISIDDLGNYYTLPMAYDAFLINDNVNDQTGEIIYNSSLETLGNNKNSLSQSESIKTEGSMGEYVFAFGANYAHNLYIGMAFGVDVLRYEEHNRVKEFDINGDIHDFQSLEYNDYVKAHGTGFNVKLGFIYRPKEWLRIGAAIHTPTFWDINEEYRSTLNSELDTYDDAGHNTYAITQPELEHNFELTTPFKANAGLGVMINKTAMVSFDYEFIDYSKARLRSSEIDFDYENTEIEDQLAAAHNFKIGGEYKLGLFSLRCGYGFYGSPYASSSNQKDAVRHSFSAGAGINSNSFFLDFAFTKVLQEETIHMYKLTDDLYSKADLKGNTNNMMLTFGFRF